MTFADLEHLDLSTFISRTADPDALWLFLHIPKTAGSSLSIELAAARPPYRNIFVAEETPESPYVGELQKAVDRFIADSAAGPFNSASGHVKYNHVAQIKAAEPRTRTFTFLRNPVSRLLSEFRYQRTPKHPQFEEFIARFPTIEDYIEDISAKNIMTRFLFGLRNRDPLPDPQEAARDILTKFDFIGVQEMYPMCFNILFMLFGLDKRPNVYERKTEENQHNQVALSPAVSRRIRELNQVDVAIFDSVIATLRNRRQEWVEIGRAHV